MCRRIAAVVLALLLLTGCSRAPAAPKQYNATFLTLFDTVTTVIGRAESEEAFMEQAQQVHDTLLEYHQLFDIYNDYEGIVNLKTLNDRASASVVSVDRKIIDLLLDCKEYYRLTDGKVNVAMGSVLRLWHDARDASLDDPAHAFLPTMPIVEEAAEHINLDHVIIDEVNATIFFEDPALKLDVGAIAKGWSVQRAAESLPEGLLISVGGNVCATGPKDASGTPWVVGVSAPDGGDYLHTLNITGGSVVTSGDYQRYFTVDGKRYHHIIDPATLMPSEYWRSVTILCDDSGLADALSTALFLLPLEEGQALLEVCGAEAMWVDSDGNEYFSPGFQDKIRT